MLKPEELVIVFKPLAEIISTESEKVYSPKSPPLNKVAESIENYKSG